MNKLNTNSTYGRYSAAPKGTDPASTKKLQAILADGVLGKYSPEAAYVCAVASAWVYSDQQTMADMMARQGLNQNLCVRIRAQNDAMLVAATADLVLSADGTVGVLCFRGTEPRNIMNWLGDFTTRPIEMPGEQGLVHGGMYRNLMAIWDDIVRCLRRALPKQAAPQPLGLEMVEMGVQGSVSLPPDSDTSDANPMKDAHRTLATLYVTGHSLGGAMAAFAAVRLLTECPDIARVMRGVYTFGQPLIANQAFVDKLDGSVQRAVMRHVYDRDVVPRFPPRSMGKLASFGPERIGRETIERGGNEEPSPWVLSEEPVTQASGLFINALLAVGDYVVQQFPRFHAVRLPYSLENHFPRHYIACSLLPGQKSEFDPPPWLSA